MDAVDLTSGDVRCEVPLATMAELSAVPEAGQLGFAESRRHPHTTAGGFVFIAAARATVPRAFDVETGTMLWAGPAS